MSLKKFFPFLKTVVFADEIFGYNLKWTKEFCSQFPKKINLPFAAFFHPLLIKQEVIINLKKAGLIHARIGIQSGSETIRKKIYKRPESNIQILKVINIFHQAKIRLSIDIIVNSPFEEEKQLRETLDFLLKVPHPFELVLNSLVYFPKTELTNLALKKGYIRLKQVEGNNDEGLRFTNVLVKNKSSYPYKRNLFWVSLFSLTSKPFIPRLLIEFLANKIFWRQHPIFIYYFAKLINFINLIFIAFNMVKNKEIGKQEMITALKTIKYTLSVNK